MKIYCRHCGTVDAKVTVQRFEDRSEHLRADCGKCGMFVRYLQKTDGNRELVDGVHGEATMGSPQLGLFGSR